MPGPVPPRGYSDATLSGPGLRTLHIAGHVAFDADRRILHPGDLLLQLPVVLRNLGATLREAGAVPEDLVKLVIFTTDVAGWRARRREIGVIWRGELGPVYPAMTLVGVSALFDPGAVVEIEGVARF
jgi:enamine deaminase RidA (YjgF/YER057c/UK114 family)